MNLRVRDIRFRYSEKSTWVLNGHTRDYAPGGFIAFQGYSGSGKSTLLKVIGGLMPPTSGEVISPLGRSASSHEYLLKEVGYVFQQLNLLPTAPVRRNIELAWAASGMNPAEATRETARILDFVGLGDLANRTPETLSGGQQQRAAIARALVKHPSVLLMDEPTTGLDDENTGRILEIIAALPKETVCIVATHDHRILPAAREIVKFPLA